MSNIDDSPYQLALYKASFKVNKKKKKSLRPPALPAPEEDDNGWVKVPSFVVD